MLRVPPTASSPEDVEFVAGSLYENWAFCMDVAGQPGAAQKARAAAARIRSSNGLSTSATTTTSTTTTTTTTTTITTEKTKKPL